MKRYFLCFSLITLLAIIPAGALAVIWLGWWNGWSDLRTALLCSAIPVWSLITFLLAEADSRDE